MAFETGLLGFSGMLMVDNGTMCGSGMACYAGSCVSLSVAQQQMVKTNSDKIV
jgi:hypothetical protein